MGILNNLENILRHKFLIYFLIIVFSFVATKVAEAKTITSSVSFSDETRLTYVEDVYKRSNYNHYLLGIENTSSGYSSVNNYYLCLTDNDIEITDELNAISSCEKMYTYYRNSDGDYVLEEYNDNILIMKNSVFYTSNIYNTEKITTYFEIGIFLMLVVIMLKEIFDSWW